jgi:hypothetical protein
MASAVVISIGKGVIYYMKDEYNNECPYDFKNIQFMRCLDEEGNLDTENGEDTWCYTFGGSQCDRSIRQEDLHTFNNNRIGTYYMGCNEAFSIPNNVFLGTSECMSKNNKLGSNCDMNTFGDACQSNTFGNDCYDNLFGCNCTRNAFGTDCNSNTFGSDCYLNLFGNCCSNITFGIGCGSNTLGNDCYNNSFGYNCCYNSFGYNCGSNTFGDNCNYNTFGNECNDNTFGDDYQNQQFDLITYQFASFETSDKTIVGAINELNTDIGDIQTALDAIIAQTNSIIGGGA